MIKGIEVKYPVVPSQVLDWYLPDVDTWLLTWSSPKATHNAYIRMQLVVMEDIGCIERLYQEVFGDYQVCLFDLKADPNSTVFASLCTYARILFRKSYTLINPYQAQRARDAEDLVRYLYTANDEILHMYRKKFLGNPTVRNQVQGLLTETDTLANQLLDTNHTDRGNP